MKKLDNIEVEKLAATFHEIYQREARRQGDVRHADKYEDLPENIKEFDRVLARYVLQNFQPNKEEIFVRHIENHLKEMGIEGKIVCKICGKDIDEIYQEARTKEKI